MKQNQFPLIITTILLFIGFIVSGQESRDSEISTKNNNEVLDALALELQGINDQKILPGFAVTIFTKDSVLYQKGFGFADIETKKPYTTQSVQIIASITKTLVGVALMKVVEEGKLTLDDKVNDLLPFQVVNPYFPNTPITIQQLATHTSSIGESDKFDKGYRFESSLLKKDFPKAHHKYLDNYNKTEQISMGEFLENKLSSDGKWYEKKVFTKTKPGTTYEYSNLAITLLAYIIELKTGLEFSEYTNRVIIKPLKMQSSTWSLNDAKSEGHITYYNEILNIVPNYYLITYPDGGLFSSVSDMTAYLQEMMRGYKGESDLLTKKSFIEMMSKQYEDENLPDGLCWDLSMGNLIGHAGNDFGTATLMYFSPKTGIGRILFTNISIETEEQENAFYGIYNLLFGYDFGK